MTGRSWFRLVFLVLGVLFILGSGVTFALRVKWRNDLERAVRQFEEEVGPLDPYRVAPRKLEPTENAASWLIAAASALVLDAEESAALSTARVPLEEWAAEQEVAVRELLEAHPEPLALASRSVPLQASNYGARYVPGIVPIDATGAQAPKPVPDPVVDLLPQWHLSSYLTSGAALDVLTGECDGAVDRLEVAARQVRAMREERLVLFAIFGTSFSSRLIRGIAEAVAVCEDVETSARLLEILERVEAEARPADEVLRGEAVSSLAQTSVTLAREETLPFLLFGESMMGYRARLVDHWREMVLAARGGGPELRAWSQRQVERWNDPGRARGGADVIAAMLMPNLASAAEKIHLEVSSRRLAIAALSLRVAGLEEGRYPSMATLPAELREPTPYLHERIVVAERRDGGVEVSLPESASKWEETFGPQENVQAPRLVWILPPLPDS